MKLILFHLVIILYLSFIRSKKLMIVGFKRFTTKASNIEFDILIKKSIDCPNFNVLYFNITNSSNEREVTCENPSFPTNDTNDIFFQCYASNEGNIFSQKAEVKKNFNITDNNNGNSSILEVNDIELSSLANETISNIINEKEDLFYDTFFLDKIIPVDNRFILEGKMNINISNYNATLKLSTSLFVCSGNESHLTFEVNETLSDNLYGKMANITDHPNRKILIYSTSSDDYSIIYPNIKIKSVIELIGFGAYQMRNNSNANILAYLRGDPNYITKLQKYMRFTANINDGTQIKECTATGEKVNNHPVKSIIPYNVTFENTSSLNIQGITFNKNFKFSNYINSLENGEEQINIYPSNNAISLDNNPLIIEEVTFIAKPIIYKNSLSFDFEVNSTQNFNITKKSKAYMSYIPMGISERDEIECSIENKTNTFSFECKPKKDVYTYIYSLIFNIPLNSTKRLRFLQISENITFYAPADAEGTIEYTYEPEIGTFRRRVSKNKGLSGGAIAALVLASIAVIVAIGLAIFFLNRKPIIPPVKPTSELQLQNSSAKIQN